MILRSKGIVDGGADGGGWSTSTIRPRRVGNAQRGADVAGKLASSAPSWEKSHRRTVRLLDP